MNINLGNKIRYLRKQRNISQEVLAQILGVTFQAVSKWETGAAMPDVAMIPAIASFFGVSTDELFDFNRVEQEKQVMKLCEAADEYRFSDPARSEAMLRDALTKFPGNDIILNNLLYTMQGDDRSEEVVSICKSVLETTRDDEIRYDVLRILAKTYRCMGQQALVKPTLDRIPELYFSKLELVAKLTDGTEAFEAAEFQARLYRDGLMDMLSRMAQLCRTQGETEKAAVYAELTKKVYMIFDGRMDCFSYEQGVTLDWLKDEIWPRLMEG